MFNPYSSYPTQLREVNFMARVYGWMAGALAVTAVSAYWVAHTPQAITFVAQHLMLLLLVQVGIVIALSALLPRLSFIAAFALFTLYSLSMGVTLSTLFLVYTASSLGFTFIVTAGTFGAMAIYGYVTKSDLTSLGNILLMGLIGLILSSLVNMFWQNQKFDIVLSGIGVLIFTLFVAYDAQRIKHLGQEMLSDRQAINKVALLGALVLYLDFVNLFLYLLRFLGKSRNNE